MIVSWDARRAFAADVEQVKYETRFAGPADEDLKTLLIQSSELENLKNKPPVSLIALSRRAETDTDRLTEVLHSRGYYAGKLAIYIDTNRTPVRVSVQTAPGPLYHLSDFDIVWTGCDANCPEKPSLDSLGIELNQPAVAPDILAGEHELLRQLHDSGRPFADVADRQAVVNHETRTMRVTERIDPGPVVHYGPLVFQGRKEVKESFIRRLMSWREGDLYKQSQVEDFQRDLVGTGLFRTAVVEPADTKPGPDGTVPIRITLTPAKKRTVGAGIDYSTTEGPGARVFWEHRNLLGGAEDFRVTLRGNKLTRALEFTLSKPEFRRRDQTLKGALSFLDTDTDAYRERGIETEASLERPLWPNWTGSLGLSLTAARIEDKVRDNGGGPRSTFLVGLPIRLTQDSTDNLLDPRHGSRLTLSSTPEGGTIEAKGVGFVKNEAIGTGYYTLGEIPALTFAVRGRLGSILGAKRQALPANRRFYAGGGGSVRGYEYQKVGPLDSDNDPLGGRSVIELSTEFRIRITDTIGIVPFVDGGQVYTSPYPKFVRNLLWAGGLGFRYYSPIGPLRVDFAFPINRRSNDELFQFYISIGQAF